MVASVAVGINLGFRVAHALARLLSALGQDYRDYAARPRRLVPGIW